MRLLLSLLTFSFLGIATPCIAQTYFACGVNGVPLTVLGGSPFIGFTPSAPNASQAVTITVGMVDYNPISAVAVVQGKAITVTFTASYIGLTTPPPLSCSTTMVGPLSTGTYVVNLFLAADPAAQVATATLVVAAQSVSVSPPAPNSVDRPMIVVTVPGGAFPRDASSLSKSIQGNLIQLGLCQNGLDFGPNPPFTVSYVLGALAPGQYTVQFESRCAPSDPIGFAASFQFQVVDATQTLLRSAVEFFRDNAKHYFMTADPGEIDALDSGLFPGWRRTGQTIGVYNSATPLSSGLSPVCRFYGRPEAGLDSHFFSASPAECQAVIDHFSNAWIYESGDVFVVGLPNLMDGSCPAGFVPVYRLYNNRPDANHAYITSFVNRQILVSQLGWIPEGYGPDAVAMCSPTQ
jgi:hypothetical protein